MKYIKVKWQHNSPDDPVWIYSELDDQRWEVRKIEIFPDGQYGFASRKQSTLETWLGVIPVPANEEIAKHHEFQLTEISLDEFEVEWTKAKKQP
ncbi:MAG TPA: hypothetical protein VK737_03390 [Opitutales bacterium]|jgi:hypothetical protein|nr:hypothetical protein [Opitutales bacterium]